MKKVKNIQLIWLVGILMIFESCSDNKVQIFTKLSIKDSSFNLILTTNLDCSTCINQIIYGKRSTNVYHDVVFFHSQKLHY